MERAFKFLDYLRVTGTMNMFDAAPYLEEAFGFTEEEANEVLMKWMQKKRDDGITPV